jgi:BatD DUF11 like domain
MIYRWLLLWCLLLPLSAMANGVQTTLDRNEVHLGDTVTLNVRIDGITDVNTPDLSALDNDFEVLGTSANSTLSIVNGRPAAQMIIGIALRPKHIGDLQIPALTVAGSQTTPLTLHVDPSDNSASSGNSKDVFVETAAEPSHVYVGQQLLYSVRLFFDVNLNSGTLPNPQVGGADLRQLGGDLNYESERNGHRYHVVERRYALIPSHAGSLTIPSIEFQGEAADSGNPNDPGGLLGQGGLFGNTTPVTADSAPVTIDVDAAPANWGGTTWLPARTLALGLEGLPSDDKVPLGQPINLHMSVQATGLAAEALPEPSLPAIDGAKVYPDQSVNTTHNDGQWLIGRRERGFAIFPQHAGTLTIPAITLTWFDVQSGQKQVATVPARTLTVLPAANGAPATPSSTTQTAASLASPAVANSVGASAKADTLPATAPPTPWRGIAIASIGLWLLSAVAYGWFRRRKPADTPSAIPVSTDSARIRRNAFMGAARGHDPAAQAHRLLAWARAERPGLQNLGQLSAALASDSQRAVIEHLQRQQYAGASTNDAIDLAATFAQGFVWRRESESDGDSPLPPLYPFKLD